MKRFAAFCLVFFSFLLLFSCATGRYPYPDSNLAAEHWQGQMKANPSQWASKASRWFRAGGEIPAQKMNLRAPYSDAMSRTMVRVPNIDGIKISGDFQVQITGEADHAFLWIEGPGLAARSINVKVRNNVLCLEQAAKAPTNMKRVIVHVGVTRLNALIVTGGSAIVEGVRLYSNSLLVDSNSRDHIFLAGRMNVKCVISRNCGSINIFTTNTFATAIESLGSGEINLTAVGSVELSSIKHHGTGNINVLNAVSKGLKIDAYGKGQVNVSGCLAVSDIRAAGDVCVFIDKVASGTACIYVRENASVGVAGSARTLYAYTSRSGRLMSRNLFANTIFAESSGTSHMNIHGVSRAFATARDYSTIYFYGSPGLLESFQKNNGTVIKMGGGPMRSPQPARVQKRARDTLDPAIEMTANGHSGSRYQKRPSRYVV